MNKKKNRMIQICPIRIISEFNQPQTNLIGLDSSGNMWGMSYCHWGTWYKIKQKGGPKGERTCMECEYGEDRGNSILCHLQTRCNFKPKQESKRCDKCTIGSNKFIRCMLMGGCLKILKKPKPELPGQIALYGIKGQPYSQKHIDVVVDAVNQLIDRVKDLYACVHHLQGQIDCLGKTQK